MVDTCVSEIIFSLPSAIHSNQPCHVWSFSFRIKYLKGQKHWKHLHHDDAELGVRHNKTQFLLYLMTQVPFCVCSFLRIKKWWLTSKKIYAKVVGLLTDNKQVRSDICSIKSISKGFFRTRSVKAVWRANTWTHWSIHSFWMSMKREQCSMSMYCRIRWTWIIFRCLLVFTVE